MICCPNCFIDSIAKNIVSSNSQSMGKCDICGENNVRIFDLSVENDLTDAFESLIDNYILLEDFKKNNDIDGIPVRTLAQTFIDDWEIFSFDDDRVNKLLKGVCFNSYSDSPKLFEEPVVLAEQYSIDFRKENSILIDSSWEDVVEKIKHENRFYTKVFNEDALLKLFNLTEKNYSAGVEFYRGRFSKEKPFRIDDLKAPPKKIASSGRANSNGISSLYVASNIQTTFYEIKARTHDDVTVGIFKAVRPFRVVDLKRLDEVSPFHLGSLLPMYSLNKANLRKIGTEIAKPLKRNDSELDYIPTQYLADFIKSLDYDGVEYKSTINPEGYNIAIFKTEVMECIKLSQHRIDKIEYKYQNV